MPVTHSWLEDSRSSPSRTSRRSLAARSRRQRSGGSANVCEAAAARREIVVCPHDDEDGCPCRKPKPGMLVAAAERPTSIWRPVIWSAIAGETWKRETSRLPTVFLNRQYSETVPEHPDVTVRTIGEAAAWIVAQEKR